jgi:hypothetical protein
MKSTIIRAAVLTVSAFASVGSFADGIGAHYPASSATTNTIRSAVAKADLAEAKNTGEAIAADNIYPVAVTAKTSKTKTRNRLRAELTGDSSYLAYDNYLYSR